VPGIDLLPNIHADFNSSALTYVFLVCKEIVWPQQLFASSTS